MPGEWLYRQVIITAALHVIVVLLAARAGWDRAEDGMQAAEAAADGPGEGVACSHCGRTNEPGYRFYGHCGSELQATSPYTAMGAPSQRRGTR